jgi:hypothetical protein
VTVASRQKRLASVRDQLRSPWAESEERTVETGPFPITVRKRGNRYDLDDDGEAIARARALGAPADWLAIAERVVAREGFNVNRRGVLFLPVVEGRDLASLAVRLADCAASVHAVLLDAAQSNAIR